MTLAELLAQADLPSEMEFKNDMGHIIRLADLRTLNSTVDGEKARLADEVKKATAIGQEAQGLAEALRKAVDEQARKTAAAAATDDEKKGAEKAPSWRSNPLYEELLPVFDALQATVTAANTRAEAATKSLQQMSAFYSLERMRGEFNSAPEAFRKANDFNKLVQEALTNKEVYTLGEGESAISLPTLAKRIHAATEPDRIKAAVDEAIRKNNADWETKSRMAAGSGKPGGGTKFSTRKAAEAPIKRLDELTSEAVASAAASDPEFAKALEGEPV